MMKTVGSTLAGLLLLSLSSPALTAPSKHDFQVTKQVYHIAPPKPASNGYLFKDLHLPYYPPNADCHDYMIPVETLYNQVQFNATKFENEFDLQDFLSIATTRTNQPGPNNPSPLGDKTKVKRTYQIAASFCSPKTPSPKSKTVLLATHGIGPARSHWNSAFKPAEYNFVQHTVGKGYSVFFYDRLGCGASEKVSGYEAQINTAIAVLTSLGKMLREGKYTGAVGKPDKLAGIGFSFGSYTTHGAVSLSPTLFDAVILTAIGFNETGLNVNGLVRSFQNRIASQLDPALYGDRDTGYLTWVDQLAQIMNYFKKPNYEAEAVEYVEAAKEPFALTEFLTLLAGPQNVDEFKGSALHISGETDYIFCDGFCPGIFEEPAKTIYKNAKLELALHPGASHHLNFQKNATGAFEVMTGFLERNGL